MFLDFTYIFVLIGALLSFIASMNVKTTFNKYKKIHGSRGIDKKKTATKCGLMIKMYAHGESNSNRWNRNPIFYPLNYGHNCCGAKVVKSQ